VTLLRQLRKLVLGETWRLPVGIACAVVLTVVVRLVAGPGGWWREAGGLVLLGALVAAFALVFRDSR
jgi:hypothetical protein